ncbi:MAG TPA: CsgG/HfaB family protein [Candidatus Dormibacteraeota bacterium]|nr:CsgG/HfaB family protein [Candidatus Dormibacteraeota bacterium]
MARLKTNLFNTILTKVLVWWAVWFLVAMLTVQVLRAQDSKPKVAIKTFENPANFSHSTIGNGLTDILTTELQNTGKFNVMERTNVDELMKEMNFGNTEYAKSSSFSQKGNLLGAQYVLMGKVTNFSYAEQAEQQQKSTLFGPNTIETVYQQRADVRVDFRLVDVSTGETVISEPGEAHKTNTSQVSEIAAWYRSTSSGSITAELSSSLIGRATTQAIKDIVRKLNALSETVRERGAGAALNAGLEKLANAKGQVVAEEGGGLWIVGGIGSATGLQKGDRLKLTRDNVIKDKAGKIVYRKPIDIGAMEVTDVSQADHAEARFIPSPNGSVGPQTNDLVSADVDYARTLRAGIRTATPLNSSVPNSSNSQFEQFLKKADRYMEDRFWSQALEQYNKAAAVNPNDARVLQGVAATQYMLRDFIEADETSEKLLEMGYPLRAPIAHNHSVGYCTGDLVLQRGKLSFKPQKSDHGFEVDPASLVKAEITLMPRSFWDSDSKAPRSSVPVLEIRWRDSKGHEKKYDMLHYVYSKQQNISATSLDKAFPMDDVDIADLTKLERSMLALIQKYVK